MKQKVSVNKYLVNELYCELNYWDPEASLSTLHGHHFLDGLKEGPGKRFAFVYR